MPTHCGLTQLGDEPLNHTNNPVDQDRSHEAHYDLGHGRPAVWVSEPARSLHTKQWRVSGPLPIAALDP